MSETEEFLTRLTANELKNKNSRQAQRKKEVEKVTKQFYEIALPEIVNAENLGVAQHCSKCLASRVNFVF